MNGSIHWVLQFITNSHSGSVYKSPSSHTHVVVYLHYISAWFIVQSAFEVSCDSVSSVPGVPRIARTDHNVSMTGSLMAHVQCIQ